MSFIAGGYCIKFPTPKVSWSLLTTRANFEKLNEIGGNYMNFPIDRKKYRKFPTTGVSYRKLPINRVKKFLQFGSFLQLEDAVQKYLWLEEALIEHL